ncbi:MAG TPA: hypothetical protein VEZ18_04805 [Geodermatophilus sp.]|nr:hypothetical protein [Geodermatophilus sp.]
MSVEGARLDLTADLSIEVDGAPVRVTAEGADLRVVAADVRGFMLGLQAATARNGTRPGRADVRELAGALADAGLTARLYSPSQHVVTVGAGVDSAVGGLLLSTRKAQPDALGILRASGRVRAVETALAGALLLGIALVRRRRRAAGEEPPVAFEPRTARFSGVGGPGSIRRPRGASRACRGVRRTAAAGNAASAPTR